MVFAHIPIKLTTKNGMRTLQKINPHFSYIRFTYQQKIEDERLNEDVCIRFNQIKFIKKSDKNFS